MKLIITQDRDEKHTIITTIESENIYKKYWKCQTVRLGFGRSRVYRIGCVEHKGLKVSCQLAD